MEKRDVHIPIRTCICCRAKKEKGTLYRLVLNRQGKVVWDRDGTMHGRGAYVCPDRVCLDRVKAGKGLSRAFKRTGMLPPNERGLMGHPVPEVKRMIAQNRAEGVC